jgi:hypothetical protein
VGVASSAAIGLSQQEFTDLPERLDQRRGFRIGGDDDIYR